MLRLPLSTVNYGYKAVVIFVSKVEGCVHNVPSNLNLGASVVVYSVGGFRLRGWCNFEISLIFRFTAKNLTISREGYEG